ncbi:MAG: PLP-dependent aminotransferase family protein [Burkholderiales bacterium]|nr:PLP-dependent aminotransferase family protein [Burkholderiales bacterium]
MTDAASQDDPPHRYQVLADDLAQRIERGLLKPGNRVPSVRELCRIYTASPATVIHALHLLEDSGLVEARPRSGFFVRRLGKKLGAAQQCAAPSLPQPIELDEHHRLASEFRHNVGDDSLGRARVDPDFYPCVALQKLMTQIARRDPHTLANPPPVGGDLRLRAQLARRSVHLGCDWQPEEIMVTHGDTQAIATCLRLVAQPGDVIAIQSPSNIALLNLLETMHMRVLEIPSHPCDGLSVDALEFALKHEKITACVLSANFPTPTGSLMSDAAKQRTVNLLAEHHVPLIEEDSLGDFYFGNRRPPPFKSFDRGGNVLYCADLSTLLGIGLSLGFVVTGRYRLTFEQAQFTASEPPPLLFQQTVAAFMESGQFEPYLRRLRNTLADTAAAYRCAVAEHFPSEARMTCAEGGFLLWVELPRGVDTSELQRRALAHDIRFAPGRFFSHERSFENCLRLNAGFAFTPAIEAAIATLGRLATELCAETSGRPAVRATVQ